MDRKIYQSQQNYYHNSIQRRKAMNNYAKFHGMFRQLLRMKRHEKHPLIGCTLFKLADHLEEQFQPGMTWVNYGKRWQIDHIDPISMFDLTKQDQILACWHYTNLRPISLMAHYKKRNGLVLRH